jgi:protein O-mannosyl-transferase
MEDKINARGTFLKAAMLIIAVTAAVYANSLRNSFVWDDAVIIERNDFIRSGKNLPSLFSRSYLTSYSKIDSMEFYTNAGSGEESYRPVTTATYFLDYRIWKLNPFGYHLTNLLLHIFNAILLFIFVKLIVKNYQIALLASLLFALHPVSAEAVGVISFREDLLVFLFYLSSLILYIRMENAPGRRKKALFYGFSLVLFLFALFSKEMAVSLPLVLILYDYFFVFKQKGKEIFINFKSRYLGHILVLSFYLFAAFCVIGRTSEDSGKGLLTNLLTMPKVFATYIQWLLLPFNLHVTLPDDPLLIARSLYEPAVLFSIALLVLSFIFAVKIRKRSGIISFAAFWFFLTLLPVSNIVPIMNYIACRYLYIPALGFCLATAVIISRMKKFAGYTALLVLAFYFMLTFIRNAVWKDNIILWSEMTSFYPQNALAHSGLGNSLRNAGLLDEAIGEYKLALSLDPNYAKDYNGLGVCYFEKMMLGEAISAFQKALAVDPKLLAAYNNLGSALGEKGLYAEAAVYFNRAISIDRGYVPAYSGLGITYARLKKFDAAKRLWTDALKINPGDPAARENLEKLKKVGH